MFLLPGVEALEVSYAEGKGKYWKYDGIVMFSALMISG